MASSKLLKPPKPPTDFKPEMTQHWRDICARFIDATGSMYKADIPLVEMLCRAAAKLKEIQEATRDAPLLNDRGRVNPLIKFEADLQSALKQHYRALELTIKERVNLKKYAAADGEHGGQKGVRQGKARDGVPSFKKCETGSISWLDEARAKAQQK
jgi:phage terminase small subunit